MKLLNVLALASAASAHTLFTTLYIDGKNQGDGTCVRMPKDGATGTAPIYPITGDAMACGYGGRDPVPFVCPASSGAKLTFEFRLWPDYQQPGALDTGHKGPCAVYLKRVDDMFKDPAAGDGWFKIWDDGYDNSTRQWCSDRLIAHDGLLSVDLPASLASGYYLVRPEILALHFAYKGDPQFYLGCVQIFIQGGPSDAPAVPKDKMVSIPGYVNPDTPGLGFDIYKDTLPAYPMPGPAVYVPKSSSGGALKLAAAAQKLSKGAVPETCLIKNANWCAKELAPYSDQAGCWAGVKDCYDQSKRCWDSARASGSANCYTWSDYCTAMNDACEREEFTGPPAFRGKEKFATKPGNIPEPWGTRNSKGDERESPAGEKKKADDGGAPDGEKKKADDGESPAGEKKTDDGGSPDGEKKKVDDGESPAGEKKKVDDGESPAGEKKKVDDGESPSGEKKKVDDGESPAGEKKKADDDVAVTTTTMVTEVRTKTATKSTTKSTDTATVGGGGGTVVWEVSKDGKCGPEFGQTCSRSAFGDCCSKKAECGRKARHCACGCVPEFGSCW
ncbi:endoglucanase B [Cordyceps fumosorosea ARSEF 2679]|uniref:lytic cellulose monooxygenase (C4-dehydrogenating) n=1 Tax=Cordyceps fumosorosea (strain ARSEF 2679) TaxID=1081104 RepID=A0A167TMS6_CORFA|nr:endoglucanase B [Cordyceps fumosorosea ARSEF 2679]OAA60760.1 endoglucanase B [Cordyceps fumosorosea ARSEF 2679]